MRLFKRKTTKLSPAKSSQSFSTQMGVFSPAIDLPEPDPEQEQRRLAELEQIFIRSKRLKSLDDVPEIVDEIRNGNIVLLDITSLNNGNEQAYLKLKRIIERIRGETRGYSAEIALVNDNCIIVTPSFVKF